MVKIRVRASNGILRYFRENPGSVFIIAFLILLVVSAVSMAYGAIAFVNAASTYAYYFLVIGVIIQLVVAKGKNRDKEERR